MNTEFAEEVDELIKERIAFLASKNPVVFYGSSSLRLWDSLEQDLPELDTLNIAFGGSVIQDCIDYFDLLIAKTKPSKVFFYAGDNDIGQGDTADEVVRKFDVFFEKFKKTFGPLPFVFISIKPSPLRMEYIDIINDVNQRIKERMSLHENAYFLDIHTPMLKGDQVNENLFLDDLLHMNELGYQIWKQEIRGFLGLS